METPPVQPTNSNHIHQVRSPTTISNVMVHITPNILTLPHATKLHGTVTGQDAKGNSIISTKEGALTLNRHMQLQKGQKLTFELLTGSGATQLRLIAINGAAPNLALLPKIPHQLEGMRPTDIFRVVPGMTHIMTQPLATAAAKKNNEKKATNSEQHKQPATQLSLPSFQPGKELQTTLLSLHAKNFEQFNAPPVRGYKKLESRT